MNATTPVLSNGAIEIPPATHPVLLPYPCKALGRAYLYRVMLLIPLFF